jgi:hypothetical protein
MTHKFEYFKAKTSSPGRFSKLLKMFCKPMRFNSITIIVFQSLHNLLLKLSTVALTEIRLNQNLPYHRVNPLQHWHFLKYCHFFINILMLTHKFVIHRFHWCWWKVWSGKERSFQRYSFPVKMDNHSSMFITLFWLCLKLYSVEVQFFFGAWCIYAIVSSLCYPVLCTTW